MIYGFMPFAAFGRKAVRLRKNLLGAAFVTATVLTGASLWGESAAWAARSNLAGEIKERSGTVLADSGPVPPVEVIQTLSGSPYPGVIDCLLKRSWQEGQAGARPDIHINYPSFGIKPVDEDIRNWVSDMADAFTSHLDPLGIRSGNRYDNTDAIIDAALSGEMADLEESGQYELWGGYRISKPSDAAVSIAFELWNYTGAPEGNLDIITLNYSLLTGQRLDFVDIFEKPDVALALMSSWTRKQLEPRLGAALRSQMLIEGTEPLVENFSSLTLTPEGICINFQPWQVAPSDAGIQKVLMPLEELMPSAPLLALWGKGEDTHANAGID